MTLSDYYLAMEAYAIKRTLHREDIALQAWFNQTVQATKGSDKHPKPMYRKFDEFYNTEELEDEIRSSFEDDYVSERTKARDEQAAINERFAKLQEIKRRKGEK
ncbi:hypothetical protein LFYK43_11080 [Ligilactobacillus salitolerans]|uniref:Uncharacterized protein n=1 Tax=Ligilactobacillus salitolerans TaxID=1808352 RepID=A0A401IT01_9LACO|nr:hypothetical protein LFYK43_11080 [Ligilactobacillus salitolerans]